MEMESCVPPGFRFHPTEEELVGYYLTRKVASQKMDIEVITDVDLYRIEPWDLQDRCKNGHEDQNEWYFFSHKDKKYPTGSRTNRATAAGFWKATGRDKAVISKCKIIGMRKTLVFYEGRAPNGRKTDWIMHEYRLQSSEHAPPQEEGWVVCRAFKKPTPNQRQHFPHWNPQFYPKDNDSHLRSYQTPPDYERSPYLSNPFLGGNNAYQEQAFNCDDELESKQPSSHIGQHLKLPHLNSPSMPQSFTTSECIEPQHVAGRSELKGSYPGGGFVDWRALDRLLGSQLNDSLSSSNSNMPLMNMEYEVDTQNNGDHFINPNNGDHFINPFSNL